MNRRVNDNITTQQYFNNNGKGFNAPQIIKVDDLNIKVEVYSHNLKVKKIPNVEKEVKETIDHFKDYFGLERSNSEQILKIYVFDDKADYTYLGGNQNFNFGLGDEGGKCYYRGESDVFAEMYVYQQGNVHNLQHELAHGLTYLATGGKSLPTVLMEGISDYCEHLSNHKFNSQGSSIDKTQAKDLNLDEILKLQYSDEGEQNSLVYKTGHALVMYLKEKNPHLLKDYMETLRVGASEKSQKFVNDIIQSNDDFKDWLADHNTEVAMKDINALQIEKGEFIGIKKEIVNGEIKDVSYYRADINKIDGGNVGSFSPVEHVSVYDYARAINRATNDNLDISKEYNFLKVIEAPNGQHKLTYCDKQGNEYKNTLEYKEQAFRVISNYKESLKESREQELKKLDESIRQESSEVISKYHSREISYQEMLKEYNFVHSSSRYEDLKSSMFDNIIRAGLEKIKAEKGIDVDKILDGLVNIDSNLIENITLQNGKVFSLKALGHGDKGALSVYDGDVKIGELSSEAGFFQQVEGQTKDTFLFEDILHGLNVQYEGGAYMTITKENGHYKASFIDGRKVESDEYFKESHLHENELLNPSMNHIKEENLDSLLLNNTKILNHKDSKFAQYSDEQKQHGIIVEKGDLLNDQGTDRIDDDVYEAVISQGGQSLHTFKNIGFYVTEERHDVKGREASQLFIHDHGKDIRFELPSNITHLKLVQKNGENKLVPATENGVECSNIPDEYKYIDPIFAHEYEKRDYSHKHVNIGLINLDRYEPGTLFAIKYDPNDYNIQRNSRGEIIRLNDQTYFTKVKLLHNEEDIGMLSNNFHNFKDKIFFSADYNYSYSDFLVSVSPQVEIKDMGNGNKRITFDQGSGDIGDTNKGYTDHQKIFIKETQSKQQVREEQNDENSPTKAAPSSIHSGRAEEHEATPQDSHIRSKRMQSDQPIQQSTSVNSQESRVDNTQHNDERSSSGRISDKQAGNRSYSESSMQNEILRGEDLDERDPSSYTPLHRAVFKNELEEVRSLIHQGAKVDIQDQDGITPLSHAVGLNNEKIVKFLVEKGKADVNLGMHMDKPLFVAVIQGNKELAEYLISKGADVNAHVNVHVSRPLFTSVATDGQNYDTYGETLLHEVARRGNLDMVKFLVEEAHAETNVLADGWLGTPLHSAATHGHIEVAEYLIKKGLDINILTNGYTPLHSAVLHNQLDTVKYLMEAGADLHIKGQGQGNKCTPLALAKKIGSTEIVKYMDSEISNLLHNNTTSHGRTDVTIKHSLDHGRLDVIMNSIKDAVYNFKHTFNTSDHDRKIDVYIFNNLNDYQGYLKNMGRAIDNGVVSYTAMNNFDANNHADVGGNGADVYVYLNSEGNVNQDTLEREIGHAMQLTNLGLSYILPTAVREGMASYIAGLENGNHINDHKDINTLSKIKSKNLKADEILHDGYYGQNCYSEIEQVIKFLEDKHPGMVDKLLIDLSQFSQHVAVDQVAQQITDGYQLFNEFVENLKNYDSEFKIWVEEQIRNQSPELNGQKDHHNTMSNSIHDQHAQSDRPTQSNELKDHHGQLVQLDKQQGQAAGSVSNAPDLFEQSDKPPVKEKREVKQQEPVILKDTILKIEKSYDQDSQGKHKANVVIDYYDMKALYEKAEGAEKQPVLEFWNKLHVSEYKVGVLPEKKYYFMEDKFFIHDDQGKKCIVLPEDKISIKVMKLGNDYNLVISNEKGDVINSISKVENLNYDLLSDSGSFDLETKNSIELADQHSEYDLYLINGLGGEMFNCTDNYNSHDHILI